MDDNAPSIAGEQRTSLCVVHRIVCMCGEGVEDSRTGERERECVCRVCVSSVCVCVCVQPLKKFGRRLKEEPNDVTMVHHEEGRCLKWSERARRGCARHAGDWIGLACRSLGSTTESKYCSSSGCASRKSTLGCIEGGRDISIIISVSANCIEHRPCCRHL